MFRTTLAVLVAAALLLVTACGSGTPGASGSGGPASGDTLIVYTNSGSDGRDAWLVDRAKAAGFDIQVVQAGGGDVKNKIINEKANPVADVVFGLNNFYLEQIVAAGAVEAYKPSWSDKTDPAQGDPSGKGYYWPIVQQGIVLPYKADAALKPADWSDLWSKPEWKDKYEVPTSVTGATTQLAIAGILSRYRDDRGENGISAEGWNAIKAYFANGRKAEKGVDLFKQMADGKVITGQMFTSGVIQREKQYQIQVQLMQPAIGAPFATEQVALVAGSKKAERAKQFIDWFGGAEVQGAWSKEFTSLPANSDAVANADPAVVELHKGLKVQNIDWTWVGQNMDAWVEKITLEYLN